MKKVTTLFEEGKITMPIDKVFHISELDDSLRYFGKGEHVGKVVLSYDQSLNQRKIKVSNAMYILFFILEI